MHSEATGESGGCETFANGGTDGGGRLAESVSSGLTRWCNTL